MFAVDVLYFSRAQVLDIAHSGYAAIPQLANQAIENTVYAQLLLETNVPSLEEVLIFTKQMRQTIWLEIKQSQRYPGMIDRVLGLLLALLI